MTTSSISFTEPHFQLVGDDTAGQGHLEGYSAGSSEETQTYICTLN